MWEYCVNSWWNLHIVSCNLEVFCFFLVMAHIDMLASCLVRKCWFCVWVELFVSVEICHLGKALLLVLKICVIIASLSCWSSQIFKQNVEFCLWFGEGNGFWVCWFWTCIRGSLSNGSCKQSFDSWCVCEVWLSYLAYNLKNLRLNLFILE